MGLAVIPTDVPDPVEIAPAAELDDGDVGDIAGAAPIVLKLTPEACGERLDKILSRLVTQYSRSRIQQWIESGHVLVDGHTARAKMTVLGDENITISPQSAPDEHAFTAEAMPLAIEYEDASILVINKPAGLVVHPAAGNWTGTLLNGLLHHYPAIAGVPRAGMMKS